LLTVTIVAIGTGRRATAESANPKSFRIGKIVITRSIRLMGKWASRLSEAKQ
jgi:hypothetical protein